MNSRRDVAREWIKQKQCSQRRACELLSVARSLLHYESQKKENPQLLKDLFEIKQKHPYFGCPRVLWALRRKGHHVNGKKVYRLLKTLRLTVEVKRKKKRLFVPPKQTLPQACRVGEVWSMDFVFDRFRNGTSFRCFTIVDNLSREVPGIYASTSMAGFTPVHYLEKLKNKVQLPKHFIMDNGPEFANQIFIKWCLDHDISVHFIDPGKPVQNAYIESFNGKLRQEFLNLKSFSDLASLRYHLENWIKYYNQERPHSSLDYLTPKEFAEEQLSMLNRENKLLVLKTG